MNTSDTHRMKVLLATIAMLLLAVSMPATAQPTYKAKLELGKNQAGKVLEYLSGKRMPNGNIRYDATIDGRKRVVIYKLSRQDRALSVSIDDGAGGGAMEYRVRPIAKPGGTALVYQKIEWVILAGGNVIGQTTSDKNDKDVLITLNPGASYDAYSMDVLLHLPSEIGALDPGKLLDGGGTPEAQSAGSVFKKLLDILIGGAKYERDCQTTKVKVCKCSAACVQAPNTPPGDCSCSDCCGVCCGGECTITEEEQRNCSATVSIGKAD